MRVEQIGLDLTSGMPSNTGACKLEHDFSTSCAALLEDCTASTELKTLLGGSGDLVSMLITPLAHVITLLTPMIDLLNRFP